MFNPDGFPCMCSGGWSPLIAGWRALQRLVMELSPNPPCGNRTSDLWVVRSDAFSIGLWVPFSASLRAHIICASSCVSGYVRVVHATHQA